MAQTNIPTSKNSRARERLKAYYGLESTPTKKVDLDTAGFDSEAFLEQLYSKSSITDLIRTDNEWASQIKKLDSDRKNLVYENYSKFINASESISKMKTDLQAMRSELNVASSTMDSLERCSKTINVGLEDSRQKLDELYRKNAMLKKLRFIFELPQRLTSNIEKGHIEDAIQQYSFTASLLSRYKHLEIFSGIEKECTAIIKKVETSLWKKLENKGMSILEITSSLKLLVGIRRDLTPEKIYGILLKLCFPKLKAIASKYQEKFNSGFNKSITEQLELIKSFHEELLPALDQLITQFTCLFTSNLDSITSSNHSLNVLILSEDELSKIREKFVSCVHDLFDQDYNQLLLLVLKLPQKGLHSIDLCHFTTIFSYCLTALADYSSISGNNSSINLVQRFRLNICDWEKKLIETLFEDVNSSFSSKIKQIWLPKDSDLNDSFTVQSSLITVKNELLELLIYKVQPLLEKFISSDIAFWQLSGTWGFFFRYLQTTFRGFWERLLELEESFEYLDFSSSKFLLLKSRLFLDLHINIIQTVYDSYIKGIIQSLSIPHSHQPSENEVIEEWIGDCLYVLDQSRVKSREILKQSTIQIGHTLHDYLQPLFDSTNWLELSKPTCISESWINVFKKYQFFEKWISVLYPSKNDSDAFTSSNSRNSEVFSPERGSFQAGMSSPSISSFGINQSGSQLAVNDVLHKQKQMMAHIDRLFLDRIHIFSTVNNSLESIVISFTKVFIKAVVETIRLQFFGKHGFQQTQLDIEYFKRKISFYIVNDVAINTLLEESFLSAVKRCTEPIYLDDESIISIIGSTSQD